LWKILFKGGGVQKGEKRVEGVEGKGFVRKGQT
jgi:hypothetical protein